MTTLLIYSRYWCGIFNKEAYLGKRQKIRKQEIKYIFFVL